MKQNLRKEMNQLKKIGYTSIEKGLQNRSKYD